MMWHKLRCATVLNISSPDPNQSNAVIMPTCSNLSVGFGGRSFSTLVKLTAPCTSCRRPAAVPMVHLHPGRMRRGCGYPGGGCVLSHMLLHEEETQVHPSAFRWVENAVAAWDEPHRGLCVCRMGLRWPQVGGCSFSSQASPDPVEQKAACWQATVTTSGALN